MKGKIVNRSTGSDYHIEERTAKMKPSIASYHQGCRGERQLSEALGQRATAGRWSEGPETPSEIDNG